MIDWLMYVEIAVAVLAGLLAVVLGLVGRRPDDITMGATVLVEAVVLVQIVVAALAPAFGNTPTGSGVEFWIYLITAALLPPLAVVWGLVEPNRWSTVILGIASLAIAVMLYRMGKIWFVQVA